MVLIRRQKAKLEEAKMKMLRFLGIMKLDWVRNEHIRGIVHVRKFTDKDRLGWFRYVQRRGENYIGNRML